MDGRFSVVLIMNSNNTNVNDPSGEGLIDNSNNTQMNMSNDPSGEEGLIDDNKVSNSVVDEEESSTKVSNNTPQTEQLSYHAIDDSIFLGRWILTNSSSSTKLIKVVGGDMIFSRIKEGEYHVKTTFRERYCYCFKYTWSELALIRFTEDNKFIEINMKTGSKSYGRIEDDNKFRIVAKDTTIIEFCGDMCYVKIVDSRASLYMTQEYKRASKYAHTETTTK